MKTIKFLEHYKVKDDVGAEYPKGHTERMTDASADHFINRGVAVQVEDAPKKPGRPSKSDSVADTGKSDGRGVGKRSVSHKG